MSYKKFTALLVVGTIHILSAKMKDNQPSSIRIETAALVQYAPIRQTKQGVAEFLRTVFNRPDYAQEVLAVDCSHITQLLEYAHETYGTRTHLRHVLRMCTNKLKAAGYVNARAFSALLDDMFPIFSTACADAQITAFENEKGLVYSLIFERFLNQFSAFQENHKLFLETLSADIVQQMYNQQAASDVRADELRQALYNLCDTMSGKLVWDPADGVRTLELTTHIAEQLATYVEAEILPDEDALNDLCTSILERYCYFLDLIAQEVPRTFFVDLRTRTAQIKTPLLDLEELEECLETKRQRFTRALMGAEAQCRVRDAGLNPPVTTAT